MDRALLCHVLLFMTITLKIVSNLQYIKLTKLVIVLSFTIKSSSHQVIKSSSHQVIKSSSLSEWESHQVIKSSSHQVIKSSNPRLMEFNIYPNNIQKNIV